MSYNYYDHLAKTEQVQDSLDRAVVDSIIGHIQSLEKFRIIDLPGMYILDFKTREYLFFFQKRTTTGGIYSEDFLDGGLPFFFDNMHKEDLEVCMMKAFEMNMSYLKDIPYSRHNEYVFSLSFRHKKKQGGYTNFQHRNMYLQSSPDGLPLYSMGMAYVIPDVNTNHIEHTIEKNFGLFSLDQREIMYSRKYFVREDDRVLTDREKEIVKRMAEGHTSQQGPTTHQCSDREKA